MGADWGQSFRNELQAKKLSLSPSSPELLLEPRWHIRPWVWLLYRVLAFLYTLAWCIHSALLFNTPKWLILLSHLAYCVLALYYFTALVNLSAASFLIRRFCSTEVKGGGGEQWALLRLPASLSAALRLQWLLLVLVGSFSLNVSVLYWSVNYPMSRHPIKPFSINLHVVNALQVFLEVLVSSSPVHLYHYAYLLVAGLLYLLFAIFFWLAGFTNMNGQPYVYKVLDFGSHPGIAVLSSVGFSLVGLPLFHAALWVVQVLRERLAEGPRGRRHALRREAWWWGNVGGLAPFLSSSPMESQAPVFARGDGEPQVLLTALPHGYCSVTSDSPADCPSFAAA
ncbi:uncharacterized protein LOC134463454 [Engraulis encrasicolus]|uniref:uncharacterized protein LOC134463454 n=1 Tax=Engraulis encrasicolus TaxID=184585 RepID=UPI002FD7989A